MEIFYIIFITLCVISAIAYKLVCNIRKFLREIEEAGDKAYNEGFADALKFCEGTDKAIERLVELERKHSNTWYCERGEG